MSEHRWRPRRSMELSGFPVCDPLDRVHPVPWCCATQSEPVVREVNNATGRAAPCCRGRLECHLDLDGIELGRDISLELKMDGVAHTSDAVRRGEIGQVAPASKRIGVK